jgi:hypothetical protein
MSGLFINILINLLIYLFILFFQFSDSTTIFVFRYILKVFLTFKNAKLIVFYVFLRF